MKKSHNQATNSSPIALNANLKWDLVGLFALCFLFMVGITASTSKTASAASAGAALTPPTLSNINILTPSVARYEPFEAEFDIKTVATFPDLPFDASPPAGLAPGIGITVDALFSPDNWKTIIVQPAFLYQPYTYTVQSDRDHFTPAGAPRWQVRFAPQTAGNWQMRLRATDNGGTTTFPSDHAFPFTVTSGEGGRYDGLRTNPYTSHGFVRVSKNDPRYFEFEDGTPFLGLGYTPNLGNIDHINNRFRDWEVNGLQFARIWLSGAGLNGSQWTPWAFPKQPYEYGMPAVRIDPHIKFPGSDFSFRVPYDIHCEFDDFWQGGIPVEPNTTYSISVRALLYKVTPKPGATNAGFTISTGGFPDKGCAATATNALVPPRSGSSDWYTTTGTYTTGANDHWLTYLYLNMLNVITGSTFVDSIHVFAQNDPNQIDILRRPDADSHMYFDSMNAAEWDHIIQAAQDHGVYLKLVSDEKNEWIRNVIQADGKIGKYDNNNFYAAPDTKVRWLDEAFWRYLIARWGYSTAIHSFEFVNESDPYNGNAYNAANAMAQYFHAHDPSQHMVTTSFWTSFPNTEFWSNPKYSALDYADLHAYITTGWGTNATFVPAKNLDTNPDDALDGKTSFHVVATQNLNQSIIPRGITLNEPGEWILRYQMKADNFVSNCKTPGTDHLRLTWTISGSSKSSGSVPAQLSPSADCSTPAGTFDWREFSSQTDGNGAALPIQKRIVINDTLPHELSLSVMNSNGVNGDAWIDGIELISPSGVKVPVLGQFDNTPFDKDTAWLTAAYSLLWGGASPVGADKPLVRGETGINSKDNPNGLPDLNNDKDGVWLHNFVWGQINPGGMYDLYWWGKEQIEGNPYNGRSDSIVWQYLTFAQFMADVPLNNGHYTDAAAQVSSPSTMRAWGQRDESTGHAYLWIENLANTWDRAVADEPVAPVNGTVRLTNVKPGTYQIQWWDTWKTSDPIFLTQQIIVPDTNATNPNTLTLTLPVPLYKDVAVKIARLP